MNGQCIRNSTQPYRCSRLRQAQGDKTMEEKSLNFLEESIEEDMKNGKYKKIVTRFPAEPPLPGIILSSLI